MRGIIIAAALAVVAVEASAQEGIVEAVMYLTGASAPEELDAEVLERYEALASRPLRLNVATQARLVSSGLLSRYQAASVADYRSSSGDILSVAELALVDGFGEERARALAPFVSLETHAAPGASTLEKGKVVTEITVRDISQVSGDTSSGSRALKIRTGDADRWLVSLAAKEGRDGPLWPPDALSGSVALYGRARPFKLVLGDFNARFGQGLLLWSGFSLSGVQSAAAMDRHPSGVSAAWTLSPDSAHRGAAADCTLGRFVLSGFWSYGSFSGLNCTWLAAGGQMGATVISAGRASLDWRWSPGKWDLFGEVARDFRHAAVAAVAGGAWNPAYRVRLAASVRSYPAAFDGSLAGALRSSTRSSDERGAALALDYKQLIVSLDAASHPSKGTSRYKMILKYSPQITDLLTANFRAVCRLRPQDPHPWRRELRSELTLAAPAGLRLKGCASLCGCAAFSWLGYAELGFVREHSQRKASVYLRGTAFKADDWDDRIYIYERDIPGAFSVPAYYGRGCSLSAVVSLRLRHLRLGARAYTTAYPGMSEKKPGRAGLKLHCGFTW